MEDGDAMGGVRTPSLSPASCREASAAAADGDAAIGSPFPFPESVCDVYVGTKV